MQRCSALGVREVEAALESGDEDALTGGFKKIRRTKRQPEERPPKNKTPRRVIEAREQAPVAVPQKILAVKPPEEKEGVSEMETNKTPSVVVATQSRPEFAPCAICGFNKLNKRFLVCKACNDEYEAYDEETARQICSGKKDVISLSKFEWVLSQLNLELFDEEHKRALQERDGLHDWAVKKAEADAFASIKHVALETLAKMIVLNENKERESRQFKVKRMWVRLQAARKLKPELEQMIAVKATAEAAPAAPVTALLVVPEPAIKS